MNILFKRHYKIFLVFILLIFSWLFFSNTRIISYNFWKYITEIESTKQNINNELNIFDSSFVHEISIDISEEQYEYLLTLYKSEKVKEYVKVNISIDWTEINNVWIRLKWNIDLVEILTWTWSSTFSNNAFLVKIDEYIEWQTYNWINQLALKVDSSDSLISQLVSYDLFQELWLLAPESSYASVNFAQNETALYLVSEVIDDNFIEKYFTNTSWVLYKALNGLSFSYLWDDPVLYTELFEQETQKNNYDLKLLINLLDFVSNSSDSEFEENFEKYIDIDSYIWFLAMDELLWKDDMLLGLLNNYYIYIDTNTWIAKFLTWDQKMSFWNIWETFNEILLKYYSLKDLENITEDDLTSLLKFTRTWVELEKVSDDKGDKTYLNDLKKRFLENQNFKTLYDTKLQEYKSQIYDSWKAIEILNYYKNVYLNYSNYSLFITSSDLNSIIDEISYYINNIDDYILKKY